MKTKRVSPQTVISVILLILLAFAFIFPLYWIVTGAFKLRRTSSSSRGRWSSGSPAST